MELGGLVRGAGSSHGARRMTWTTCSFEQAEGLCGMGRHLILLTGF